MKPPFHLREEMVGGERGGSHDEYKLPDDVRGKERGREREGWVSTIN